MPRTNNLKTKIILSWLQDLHHDKTILTRKFFTNKELFDLYTSTSLDESPTISPNGNIIIYATKDGSNGYLGGITLDGKSRFSLPVKNGSVREPAWSPLLN